MICFLWDMMFGSMMVLLVMVVLKFFLVMVLTRLFGIRSVVCLFRMFMMKSSTWLVLFFFVMFIMLVIRLFLWLSMVCGVVVFSIEMWNCLLLILYFFEFMCSSLVFENVDMLDFVVNILVVKDGMLMFRLVVSFLVMVLLCGVVVGDWNFSVFDRM